MANANRKAKQSRSRRRLSRPLLDSLVSDLHGRLTDLMYEAASVATIVKPTEEHSEVEHMTRTAFLVLLGSLRERISSVHGLAEIIVDRNEVLA